MAHDGGGADRPATAVPGTDVGDFLGRATPLQRAAFSFALVFGVAYLSIVLTRQPGTASPFWPANAVLLVLALRSPQSSTRWLDLFASGCAGSIAANWLGGSSLALSAWFTAANVIEVGTGYYIIRIARPPNADQTRPVLRKLRRLLLAAFLGPVPSAIFAGLGDHVIAGGSIQETMQRWYMAATLGMLTILPIGVMDFEEALRRLRTPKGLRSAALNLCFVTTSAILIFGQTFSPFFFLVTASILIATYFHRAFGAAASVMIVAIIAVPATADGTGPMALLYPQDAMGRQLMLQLYLMAIGLVAVVETAILDDRDGLRAVSARREQEARRKAEAQSELMGHLAHEIRTPLNVIQGYALMLNERPDLDSEGRKMVEAISSASSEVQALANDILEQARASRGALRLQPAQHRIADIFYDLREEFEAAPAGVRLSFEEGSQDLIFGDRMRIKQMLRNLINNAIHYAGQYGPIQIGAQPGRDGYTRLEVIDRGPGIAPNRLHEVFEPFSRLGPDSASGRSAGMGLSLVRQLAEAQYGTVSVASAPYVETRFSIKLPAAPDAAVLAWYARGAPEIDPRSVFPD